MREAAFAALAALIVPVFGQLLVLAALGEASTPYEELDLSTILLAGLPLWLTFAGLALVIPAKRGNGPVADLGLRLRPLDVPVGIAIGVALQALAVRALYEPLFRFTDLDADDVSEAARELTDRAGGGKTVFLVVMVVVLAPVAEELFFRGLLLRGIERRFGVGWALVGSTLVFALAHGQAIQFPALVLFGAAVGYLAIRTGRLGICILCHAAFNAWTLVELLVLE